METQQLKTLFCNRYDSVQWEQVLIDLFGATEIRREKRELTSEQNDKIAGYELGKLHLDGYEIGLYEFEIKNSYRIGLNRVGLRSLVKNFTKYEVDAALVVYHPDRNSEQTQWRLSFICDLRDEATAPKRFTYVFGDPTQSYRTPLDRFKLIHDKGASKTVIHEAFSVEALNKEFFKGYKEQFYKFCNSLSAGREQTKQDRDYVKKLLGRLVFLQFLQKKGWMGVPAQSGNWQGGDANYLQNLINNNRGNEKLLTKVLEPLFFATLNEKRIGDLADKNLGDNIKIPYLNGGLFDKDKLDEQQIDFPYSYFADLADFFASYNFTIDENDPDDSEVGIDPEMLGHIFENLLEDNRDKGAFYTPKEIVRYMCRESLAQYLCSHTDEELYEAIDKLVCEGMADFFANNRAAAVQIDSLLRNVKICDPAIGSGAFPMGLLSEIFHCRRLLYGYMKSGEPFSPSKIKREIIQENIYGVDIEQGAVDIARLRFWLSLVVDETEPQPLPNLDYKIMQGNSLLESFEGVDLSILYKSDEAAIDLFSVPRKQDIVELQNRYYNTTDHAEKRGIKNEINEIIVEHLDHALRQKRLDVSANAAKTREKVASYQAWIAIGISKGETAKSQKIIDAATKELAKQAAAIIELDNKLQRLKAIDSENRPFFLWHLFFKDVFDRGGFDIVIGNPPYIQLQKDHGALAKELDHAGFQTFAPTGDIYCLFYEQGMRILREGGIEAFITSNKWMRAGYGENTRRFFVEQTNPLLLIDLGAGVFESATVDTNILILSKDKNRQQTRACILQKGGLKDLGVFVRQSAAACNFGTESWVILSPIEQRIKAKIEAVGTPLKDWNIQINYGIKTGFNDAFIISGEKRKELIEQDPKSAEIIRPLLRGRDIRRYGYEFADLYLITTFPSLKIDIDLYPAVKQHLLSFGYDRLKQTGEPGARKKTNNQWFETQDTIGYWEDFYKQKIVYIEIMTDNPDEGYDFPAFSVDEYGCILLNTAYMMSGNADDLKYILAILNSKVGRQLVKFYVMQLQNRQFRMLHQSVVEFPIPKISTQEQSVFIGLINKIITNKTADSFQCELNRLVYRLFNLSEDEIAFIDLQ